MQYRNLSKITFLNSNPMKSTQVPVNRFIIVSMCILLVFMPSCKEKLKPQKIDPGFAAYVISFTSGIVSSNSAVQVRLVAEVPGAVPGNTLSFNPFSFSAEIKGQSKWVDKQTIQFVPFEKLPAGEIYTVNFELDKFVKVPEKFSTLTFRFQVKNQGIRFEFNGISPMIENDMTRQRIRGVIYTADYAVDSLIEKAFSISGDDASNTFKWKHNSGSNVHEFSIENVERRNLPYKLKIKWDGRMIGAKSDGSWEFEMPALNDFKVIYVKTSSDPKTSVDVFFSDPLSTLQDINGLVKLSPSSEETAVAKGNIITIFTGKSITGKAELTVFSGVKNIFEKPLGNNYQTVVEFKSLKPCVELIGDGVIVPHTGDILFPFKAVSLSGVDVRIIQIFENNIVQFLQTNQLNGDQEIKRVGRVVYNNEVMLHSKDVIDYNTWNNFSLDLSKLIKTEPGAIYRVEISFRMKHSLYPGIDRNSIVDSNPYPRDPNESFDEPSEYYWDYYEDDSNYGENYNWEETNDPTKPSYYLANHKVARNVLASDFGIIAKSGTNNEYFLAVTNLLTTEPISDVEIEFRNLQNQVLATTKTNSEGLCNLKPEDKPFVLIAKKGNQRGYLRLDNASSLSLSMFDVSGEELKKGVKGFIYGERGVWRPGDLMYLTFILEDKNKALPPNHPVIMELYNPTGQLSQRIVQQSGINGFYNFNVRTPADALTGSWVAKVRVGGSTFARNLRIETVKPNRMKINLYFPAILHKNVQETGKLQVNWLYGTPASNAKVIIEASAGQAKTTFKSCKGYVFDDPAKTFESQDFEVFKGNVNTEGNAEIKLNFDPAGDAPGMIAVQLKTRAFEAGGDFSIDRALFKYSPYKAYAGLKIPEGKGWNNALYSDEKNLIPLALVDENGRPMNGKLKIEIFNIYWRWWWNQSPEENVASYVSGEHTNLMKTDYIQVRNGRAIYEMNLGGEYWGRKFMRVTDLKGGHSAGAVFYTTYKDWWSNAGSENPGGAEMLVFRTNKKQYKVGEKIQVELPVMQKSRALISIETGSRVIRNFWFTPEKGNSRAEFVVTPEMAPNIYIHISYIQPHAQSKNGIPIRMYGVQPVTVEDPGTHLKPVISMKKELKPLEKFAVTVKEINAKPMTCTVAIVDEGLLDLTRFNTPDPWTGFYAHEALGVRTWDLYKYVVGAFGGKLAGLFSVGGDLYLNKKGKENNNRFKPVVLYHTPVSLKAGESKTMFFQMPNYIGSVRVMVIAGNHGAYGSTEMTVPVKQPLMVLATLPRVVSPTEQIKVPVTVFATEKSIRNVKVVFASDKNFTVTDGAIRNLTFEKTGEKVVEFTLKVKNRIAEGKIKISATSGNEKATTETNLQIRMPNPPVTNELKATLKPGETWSQEFTAVGIQGTNSGTVEVSRIFPLNFQKNLNYLISYPHGCIEQITSVAFPQLFLGNVMELSEFRRKEIEANVKACLNKIKSYQLSGGGFAYWPSVSDKISEWGTNYAGHFMLEAEAQGYELPVGLLDPWVNYQTSQANNWQHKSNNYSSDLTQAYRIYTLALAKKPVLSAMNRMRETPGIHNAAKWRLAAAYALAGKTDIGSEIIRGLNTSATGNADYWETYGSQERDKAMMLETMVLLRNYAQALPLVEEISNILSSSAWLSTQSTAFMLMAVSKYAGLQTGAVNLECDIDLNGKALKVNTTKVMYQLPVDYNSGLRKTIKITNRTKQNLFVRVQQTGIPQMQAIVGTAQNLTFNIQYKDMKDQPLNPANIRQGTDFYAEVIVKHPGVRMAYKDLALLEIFPSGWEILSSRLDAVKNARLKGDVPTYQDIRDDRISIYFDLEKGQSKMFRVLLHAAYSGTYYLPSVRCEAMYDNSISAGSDGKWVNVVK